MSSSYPLHGDTSSRLCSHCGMVLSRNPYCTNCGYYNDLTSVNIAEQETQPSPAFNALAEDFTSQPTQKLDQYNKQSQNLSSQSSQSPPSYRRGIPSATPFLGISPDTSFSLSHPTQSPDSSGKGTSSATPFLGINPDTPFFSSQQPNFSVQDAPSVPLFLGTTLQSTPSQVDRKQSSGSGSLEPSSSYETQPTLIIPATLQERQNRSSGDLGLKQGSQYKSKKRKMLLGIMLSIVVLVIGGLAGYLFMYSPMTQKSISMPATSSSTRPKEPSEFADAFKNNSNQWDLRSEAGKYSVAITNGDLVLEDDNNSLLPELLPGNRAFSNFKMAVDAVLSKGSQKDGYGLYIRCSSDQGGNPTTYYRLELYGDSTYAIFKGMLDKQGGADPSPLKLVSYTTNSAIRKQGNSNHIEVNARSDTITIRVNGQVLKTFSDPSYTKGTVALFLSNIQDAPPGAQAKFSNLVISST